MAKAQGSTIAGRVDSSIGIFDDFSQQIALGKGLGASVIGAIAKTEIPISVILQPIGVELIDSVDVEQIEMITLLSALYAGGYLEYLLIQNVGVNTIVGVSRIIEKSPHGLLVDGMVVAEHLISVNSLF